MNDSVLGPEPQYLINRRYYYGKAWLLWYSCCDRNYYDHPHWPTMCYHARYQGGP